MLKWICNNEGITRSILEKDRSEPKCKTVEAEPKTSSPLGMQWHVDNNTLEVCRGADKEVPNKTTKGAVISFVASVFDPLELVARFTIRMRFLLTTIWANSGQQWDEKLMRKAKRSSCIGSEN